MNIGEMDQVKAALRDFVEVLAEYKKQLVAQGFSKTEIIALLVAYQTAMISPNSGKGE